MLFDTPVYFLFLLLVIPLYWRLGWRAQNRWLFAASCFFYGWWDYRFLLLMMFSATADFILGQKIADSKNPAARRTMLIGSLVFNFAVLGFFKYFNFFSHSLVAAFASIGVHLSAPVIEVLLPPGISFYTFQEVAYIVDVYRGKLEPSRRFVDYGLFISLFPHLIAGPIQNPSHLLPQVQQPRRFDPHTVFNGLMLIGFGLFRKSVIADNASNVANAAFSGSMGHNVGATVLGVIAFALQIYGDFSGYSDMARGSAQLLGFHFMVNFRQPYLSNSLQDFWRRWHISLSTWLRDYLYIGLGGNRRGTLFTYRNLMLTMLLGGLWHGANWTFVVWGGLHGFWLSVERMLPSNNDSGKWRPLGWLTTMTVVGLGWLFFRAESVGQAFTMLGDLGRLELSPGFGPMAGYITVLGAVAFAIDLRMEAYEEEYPLEKAEPAMAIAALAILGVMMAVFGPTGINAFIYFQF